MEFVDFAIFNENVNFNEICLSNPLLSFIFTPPTEKGILKKHSYGGVMLNDHGKDKWNDDRRQSGENLELITQQADITTCANDVERSMKNLDTYHEDILQAMRVAASHRGTGAGNTPSGSGSISEELLRKTLQECGSNASNYGDYKPRGSKSSSKENVCDGLQQMPTHVIVENGPSTSLMHSHRHPMHSQTHLAPVPPQQALQDDDMGTTASGQLRIRNIEDLIRQLEHHNIHMSPNGSEDIRMSENENDRHYRLDSSACSESSQG